MYNNRPRVKTVCVCACTTVMSEENDLWARCTVVYFAVLLSFNCWKFYIWHLSSKWLDVRWQCLVENRDWVSWLWMCVGWVVRERLKLFRVVSMSRQWDSRLSKFAVYTQCHLQAPQHCLWSVASFTASSPYCVSWCLLVYISETAQLNFTKFSAHANYGLWFSPPLVALW